MLWGPGRGHSAPEGAAPIRAGVWGPTLPRPLACLYKVNSQEFTGFLNPKATLYGTCYRSYGWHCPGARHILKEAPSWALFSSQVTGHVLFHTSYYMKQVLAATEVGGTPPPPPPKVAPHPDLLEILQ